MSSYHHAVFERSGMKLSISCGGTPNHQSEAAAMSRDLQPHQRGADDPGSPCWRSETLRDGGGSPTTRRVPSTSGVAFESEVVR